MIERQSSGRKIPMASNVGTMPNNILASHDDDDASNDDDDDESALNGWTKTVLWLLEDDVLGFKVAFDVVVVEAK